MATAPQRGLLFHRPEKQVGRWIPGFQESALVPSFLGPPQGSACPLRAHSGKQGAQLTPRGELIMCSPLAVSGLENVPHRERTMKELKFQMPLRALRRDCEQSPVCQLAVPTPHPTPALVSCTISTGAPWSPCLVPHPHGDVDYKSSGSFFTWTDKNSSETWRAACPRSDTKVQGPQGRNLGHCQGSRRPKVKVWLCCSDR